MVLNVVSHLYFSIELVCLALISLLLIYLETVCENYIYICQFLRVKLLFFLIPRSSVAWVRHFISGLFDDGMSEKSHHSSSKEI